MFMETSVGRHSLDEYDHLKRVKEDPTYGVLARANQIIEEETTKLNFLGDTILYTTPGIDSINQANIANRLLSTFFNATPELQSELLDIWTEVDSKSEKEDYLELLLNKRAQNKLEAETEFARIYQQSYDDDKPTTKTSPIKAIETHKLDGTDPDTDNTDTASFLKRVKSAIKKIPVDGDNSILDISALIDPKEEVKQSIRLSKQALENLTPFHKKLLASLLSAAMLSGAMSINTPNHKKSSDRSTATASQLVAREIISMTENPNDSTRHAKITPEAKKDLESIATTGRLPNKQSVTPNLAKTIVAAAKLGDATITNIGTETIKETEPAIDGKKRSTPSGVVQSISAISQTPAVVVQFPNLAAEQKAVLNLLDQGADTLVAESLPNGQSSLINGQPVKDQTNVSTNLPANSIIVSLGDSKTIRTTNTSATPNQQISESANNLGLNQAQLDIIDSLDLSAYQKVFLEGIATGVINAVKQGAKINPDVVIAQAILESGWGESQLSSIYHNPFGMKAGTTWTGPTVELPTEEFYNGQYVTIMAKWKVFSNYTEAIQDYAEMMASDPYFQMSAECSSSALAYLTALQYAVNNSCQAIGSKPPYATDPNYISSILNVIQELEIEQIVNSQ